MGNIDKDGKPGTSTRGLIDLNGLPQADRARAGQAMMRRRAQRGDPDAAPHILNHVVPDIPPDEEDQP
ncbi:hypothetical protein SAMN04244548_00043 [Paracoccus pantotrophus]|nr:hypothetical protein SAMN04244548_00043 [Paracoccus pantotrophus]